MTRDIIIDSRDLAEELDELHDRPLSEFGVGDFERMAALEELESQVYEWREGTALIPEDEFEDYAQQTAEDIGAIDPDASWPLSYIDWEAAADALRMDYTAVEFNGTTYLYR